MAQASLPSFHVTGPVHHYVRTPGTGTPWYLGTAETTPRVELRPMYRDIMNDIAGRTLPGQRTKDGQSAVVGTVLTRYSKAAYEALEEIGYTLEAGWESRFSRGGLVFGVETFELWLCFENYFNVAMRTPNLEPGYYFPQAMFAAHTRDTLGAEGEKLLLAIDCQPKWVPQASPSTVSGTERSWMLFSKDPAYFPASVQVPQ